MTSLKGKSASPGIAIGRALVLTSAVLDTRKRRVDSVDTELARFTAAIARARTELQAVHARAGKELGADDAAIFEAHLMVLDDPELVEGVTGLVRAEQINAEAAVETIIAQFVATFQAMENEYLRERASDVRDVGNRILRALTGVVGTDLASLAEDVILVARDLTPSDTATMNRRHVLGILADVGGKTSHTAIMARTLELPAVLGLKTATAIIRTGDLVAFDGETGEVLVRPDEAPLRNFKLLQEDRLRLQRELATYVGVASVTSDGRKVKLVGNIGTPADLPTLAKHDAEGVGLFRTEFLFMNRSTMPTEDEQYAAYREVLEAMGARPTIIRTLDIGGDKEVPYLRIEAEQNPFLGCRAIRYCLKEKAVFKIQLRALLRASAHGRLGIMFPMISSLEELLEAKEVLEEVRIDLRREGIVFSTEIEVGMMIEIPAAALMSDVLAKHCDFLSIGTNDLIQYTCAVDRMNESVAPLYDPCNPGVLRLIHQTIQNGHREGIWVGMCGEMAGAPEFIPLLLGMGLHEFSMAPTSILRARKILRSLRYEDAQALAREVLSLGSSREIRARLSSDT